MAITPGWIAQWTGLGEAGPKIFPNFQITIDIFFNDIFNFMTFSFRYISLSLIFNRTDDPGRRLKRTWSAETPAVQTGATATVVCNKGDKRYNPVQA